MHNTHTAHACAFFRLSKLALAMLVLFSATSALAQQAPRIEQDPAQRLLQEQRDRERQRALEQAPPQIIVPQPVQTLPADQDVESLPDVAPTFQIEHVKLIGNTVLSEAEVSQIVAPFLGKRLGSNRLNLLLRRVTDAFVSRGLITTRAYLGEQNLGGGTLTLTVVPGTIEAIRLNGQLLSNAQGNVSPEKLQGGGWLTDRGVLWAMPTAPGDVLRLSNLEQGVEQINRLRRNRAEMQILPGTIPGSSIVGLTVQPSDPLWFNLGIDNYGTSQTGSTRTNASVEADNLLGLQEMISASYSGSLDTNALVASAALPIGYHTFSYTGAISEYQTLISDTALIYGNTTGHTFGWNYVVARNQAAKTAFDMTLSRRKVERDINDLQIEPQRLTVLRIGVNTLRRFIYDGQQANWTVDGGLSRGLTAWNASRDSEAIQPSEAHSQFTKIDTTATSALPLGSIGTSMWYWRAQLNAQWSREALFGTEQIFAGGMSSVRGFQNGGISGDRGLTVRNDLSWVNAPEILGMHTEPYAFLDSGRTELIAEGRYRQVSSAGVGAKMQAAYGKHRFSSELLLGRPLVQPDYLGRKSTLLLASVNWSY